MSKTLNIKHLFPATVKTYCCLVQNYTENLHSTERIIISKAIDKRRYEFSTGRLCARNALKQLGINNCILTQGKNGEPFGRNKSLVLFRTAKNGLLLPYKQQKK